MNRNVTNLSYVTYIRKKSRQESKTELKGYVKVFNVISLQGPKAQRDTKNKSIGMIFKANNLYVLDSILKVQSQLPLLQNAGMLMHCILLVLIIKTKIGAKLKIQNTANPRLKKISKINGQTCMT